MCSWDPTLAYEEEEEEQFGADLAKLHSGALTLDEAMLTHALAQHMNVLWHRHAMASSHPAWAYQRDIAPSILYYIIPKGAHAISTRSHGVQSQPSSYLAHISLISRSHLAHKLTHLTHLRSAPSM